MDFSKFSDSDFEVKAWVNEALKAHKDSKTPLDVRMHRFLIVAPSQ